MIETLSVVKELRRKGLLEFFCRRSSAITAGKLTEPEVMMINPLVDLI